MDLSFITFPFVSLGRQAFMILSVTFCIGGLSCSVKMIRCPRNHIIAGIVIQDPLQDGIADFILCNVGERPYQIMETESNL
jgi:hypothetical protein